jgi:hypothetical protein
MFLLMLIIVGSLLFIFSPDAAGALKVVAYFAFISFICTWPTKKGALQFGRYFLVLGAAILCTLGAHQPDHEISQGVWFIWINFAAASAIALWPAIYAYRNIDEVVSRRMLYRNSNVSLFEFSWKYALDRFCNITVTIAYYGSWISFIVLTATGTLNLQKTSEVPRSDIKINEKVITTVTDEKVKASSDNSSETLRFPEANENEQTEEAKEIETPADEADNRSVTGHYERFNDISERLLTEEDISGLSKPELRILRNEIYARHGYIFKSKDLQDYFSAKDWYRPQHEDVSNLLNATEKKNVEFIKKHE